MGNSIAIVSAIVLSLASMAEPAGDLKAVFGSDEAIAIVREATSAQAWRLPAGSFQQQMMDKYKYSSKEVKIENGPMEELRALLVKPESYDFEGAKGCDPDYGVRVEFTREKVDGAKETVDVFFCFSCDILAIYHNGDYKGSEDFDKVRGEILKIIKPLFPDDRAIQQLK